MVVKIESITSLEWTVINNEKYLVFNFHGHFSEDVAYDTIMKWRREFGPIIKSGEKTNVIWNCLDMTGFDASSRREWQTTLSRYHHYIDTIWIVTTSPLFRLTAQSMSWVTKYTLKAARSIDEVGRV